MALLTGNIDRLKQLKPPSSTPKDIKKAINVIAMEDGSIIPFGSWIYKSQLYPADIDLQEKNVRCCNRNEVIKYFVNKFQSVVKRIGTLRGFYLGDIKAGLDYLFRIDIGELTYSKSGIPTIVGYDPIFIRDSLTQLFRRGFMEQSEFTKLFNMIPHSFPTAKQFEDLYDELRNKWLLRWSMDEVLKGFKHLSGGRKKTLAEAFQDDTLTKIDMWHLINGRFIEITNVYSFYYVDVRGNVELLNYENSLDRIIDDLKKEIQKYSFSTKFFKPYKLVKRLWSVARLTGDNHLVSVLTPFMQTDIGRLSQLISDIETLVTMLQSLKNPPMTSILKEIDAFRWRLANVYEVPIEENYIDNLISDLLHNSRNTIHNKQQIIDILEHIRTIFKKYVTEFTLAFLKQNNIFPPPPNYLP